MSYFIDRRLNSKNKRMVNRQRFMQRYKKHIKQAVSDAVNKRSITDMERWENISIPSQYTHEPIINHGEGGQQHRIYPGNKQFAAGDKVDRPKGAVALAQEKPATKAKVRMILAFISVKKSS